jgi:hypothetical protein
MIMYNKLSYPRINFFSNQFIIRLKDWFYSGFRNVTMPFVYNVYEKMLSNSELIPEKT